MSGRDDVLVDGKPLARLHEPVHCAPQHPADEPLVSHGAPDFSIGTTDFYLDASIPLEKALPLLEAIASRDPRAILDAYKNMPLEFYASRGTIKFVDRGHPDYPNTWGELEITGPGGKLYERPEGKVPGAGDPDVSAAGGSIQAASGTIRRVRRERDSDGSIVQHQKSFTASVGEGAGFELKLPEDGHKFDIEALFVGAGSSTTVVAKAGTPEAAPRPILDEIVAEVSADVLVAG